RCRTEDLDDEIGEALPPEIGRDRRALRRGRELHVDDRTEQRCERQLISRDRLDRLDELDAGLHGVAGVDVQQLAQWCAPGHVRDRSRVRLTLQFEHWRVTPLYQLVQQSALAAAAVTFDDPDRAGAGADDSVGLLESLQLVRASDDRE